MSAAGGLKPIRRNRWRRLPVWRPDHGTVRVGIGLVVFGLTSYVYLTVAARQLAPDDFASVAVLWSVVYIVGPGVFLPFEQNLGRAISSARAVGQSSRDTVVRSASIATVVAAGLCLVTLIAGQPLTRVLFGGSTIVLVALVLSYAVMAWTYVYRGVVAGSRRFGLYGAQLGAEGAVRFVGCALFVWWGTAAVGSFALLIPVAQALSLVAVARPQQVSTAVRAESVAPADPVDTKPGTVDSTQAPIAWLIVGALLAQVLVNAPPVLARVLARSDPAVVGQLQAGLLLARVPLFMFAAIQAVLLPSMSALVARRQLVALRRQVRAVSAVVAVAMSATTVLMALVGASIVQILFGDGFQLPGVTIALLTAGTAFFMLAGVSSSAVLAIGGFRAAAMAWGAGAAVMVGFTLLPLGVVARLVVGFAAGSAVSFALMAVLVHASTRAPRRADASTRSARHPTHRSDVQLSEMSA